MSVDARDDYRRRKEPRPRMCASAAVPLVETRLHGVTYGCGALAAAAQNPGSAALSAEQFFESFQVGQKAVAGIAGYDIPGLHDGSVGSGASDGTSYLPPTVWVRVSGRCSGWRLCGHCS